MRKKLSFLRIKERPFELLGLFAIIFLIFSFFPFKDSLDINLHDSYFVMSTESMFLICTVCYLFMWSVYVATNKFLLSIKLTKAHVIITILPTIIFMIMSTTKVATYGVPSRYYSLAEFEKAKPLFDFNVMFACVAMTLVLGQLILPINIIGGLIRNVSAKKQAS